MLSYSVSQTKWRTTAEAENSARGSAFVLLWRLSRDGIAGKFTQLGRVLHKSVGVLSANIYVITPNIFLCFLRGIMTQDARKDWRDLCRAAVAESDPAKLIAIVNELNRELDEEQKKKAAAFRQK